MSSWTCIECTYSNGASAARCDMCLTPKPPSVAINGHSQSHTHSSSIDIAEEQQLQYAFGKVPNECIVGSHILYSPHNKARDEQSIFERWMIAQMERTSGEQPAICIENGVLLSNLRRVRKPTTVRSLQQQINDNTNVVKHAENLDAGDFTDDEEEDLSSIYAASPQSSPRYPTHRIQHSSTINFGSDTRVSSKPHHGHSHSAHSKFFEKVSASPRSTHELGADFKFNHKKSLNSRRRPKSRHTQHVSVARLWFKSQSQLKEGRNPSILAKYNITLSNIRQHNPRFKDYQRRRSDHEKAKYYLNGATQKLTDAIMDNINARLTITKDEDEDESDYEDIPIDIDFNEDCEIESNSSQYANGSYEPQLFVE